MSTPCSTRFVDSCSDEPTAIIYRHTDGYPDGAGKDIQKFLNDVSQLKDKHFDDPSYLAAKYVVWLAQLYNKYEDSDSRLAFGSVGIMTEDPGYVDYCYTVRCYENDKRPTVTCRNSEGNEFPILPDTSTSLTR